jgi:hypothetical protein
LVQEEKYQEKPVKREEEKIIIIIIIIIIPLLSWSHVCCMPVTELIGGGGQCLGLTCNEH